MIHPVKKIGKQSKKQQISFWKIYMIFHLFGNRYPKSISAKSGAPLFIAIEN